MVRIHLDTDIGSDTDDACALAMLLGLPDVELVGITTTIDPGGRRAGYVARVLELAGRTDIPVAAGAEVSMTTQTMPGTIGDDKRYWRGPVAPRPSPARRGRSHSYVRASSPAPPSSRSAAIRISPISKRVNGGSLGRVPVVLMGGMIHAAAPGLPQWGPEMDWNVQCDTEAARGGRREHDRGHDRHRARHDEGTPPRGAPWPPARRRPARRVARTSSTNARDRQRDDRPRTSERRASRRPPELPLRPGCVRDRRRLARRDLRRGPPLPESSRTASSGSSPATAAAPPASPSTSTPTTSPTIGSKPSSGPRASGRSSG